MPTAITTPPKLTLYLLHQLPNTPMTFAPHAWKTVLPLARLKVPYQTVYVTLWELRNVLPQQFGKDKVTLPTLVADRNGEDEIIMDSYNIANWLESQYSTSEVSIFSPSGNSSSEAVFAGRQFARFMEDWVDKSMAAELRPCVLHTSYALFPETGHGGDPKSRACFLAKCGQTRLDELEALNGDEKWREEQYSKARAQMKLLNTLLEERSVRGESGNFLSGNVPQHVDFVVFAFYAYSLTNPSLVLNTWRHPSLPYVGKWVDSMLDTGLLGDAKLLPDPSKI